MTAHQPPSHQYQHCQQHSSTHKTTHVQAAGQVAHNSIHGVHVLHCCSPCHSFDAADAAGNATFADHLEGTNLCVWVGHRGTRQRMCGNWMTPIWSGAGAGLRRLQA
eukprot:335955-Pelagomonas_calceolata.AAC.4